MDKDNSDDPSEEIIESDLTQISKHEIDSEKTGVKVVFCVRNEKFRLPFFLKYYRDLGVVEFFAIDNNSDDDTQEYLLSQPDVNVFFTSASYKDSNAGRKWTTELADKFCIGNWCLTLDVDEFLVYPLIEHVDLNLLTSYLDRWKFQGLFSVFLDFYGSGKLSESKYVEGDSPFEICNHFDSADTYSSFDTQNFPFIQIKGGIRQRCFWDPDDPRSGPSMRKVVLVKWHNSFHYLHSTHSCSPIRFADFTAVVAHFKFMAHIKDFSKKEVERNDRVNNSGDWKVYADALETDDVRFLDSKYSKVYESSESLIDDGHMRLSLPFFDYCHKRLGESFSNATRFHRDRISQRETLTNEIRGNRSINYSHVTKLWQSIAQFNGGFRINMTSARSLNRIEDDIEEVLGSKSWGVTYPIRKLTVKLGLSDRRILVEDCQDISLYDSFRYVYGSIWWDILSLVRIPYRLLRKVRSLFIT